IRELPELLERLKDIAEKVAVRLQKAELKGRTITLKIKYHDFVITSRSRTLRQSISSSEDLFAIGSELLHNPHPPSRPVRLLGLSLSNLDNEEEENGSEQLQLGL